MKNPGCANNRGSPLYASGNSSYQILRFPNAPAAMMLIHSPTGICTDFYVLKCVRAPFWSDWRSALAIVKPETVIAWHRRRFPLYWTWKSRRARPGRSEVSREVRDLIRRMSRANPLWGAPRIHGEILKLGIELSQTTVTKYMERPRKPPSETWHTFPDSHLEQLVSTISSSCRR